MNPKIFLRTYFSAYFVTLLSSSRTQIGTFDLLYILDPQHFFLPVFFNYCHKKKHVSSYDDLILYVHMHALSSITFIIPKSPQLFLYISITGVFVINILMPSGFSNAFISVSFSLLGAKYLYSSNLSKTIPILGEALILSST